MALVLSLKKGQDFYVGDERFVVSEVYSDTHFLIWREKTKSNFEVTQMRATEITEDVFVAAGDRPAEPIARVAISAPPEILVLRGDKYRNPPGKVKGRGP